MLPNSSQNQLDQSRGRQSPAIRAVSPPIPGIKASHTSPFPCVFPLPILRLFPVANRRYSVSLSIMLLIVVASTAAEPSTDKLPEQAKQAIAAYEKVVERERSTLIDVLDKMQPETQAEIAALKAYIKAIQGEKVTPTAKKPKTSKLTRRKLGETIDVLQDATVIAKLDANLADLTNDVCVCKATGQLGLFGMPVKNAIIEFEYRSSSSTADAKMLVRNTYNLSPTPEKRGCYNVHFGAYTGNISGLGNKYSPKIPPKAKVFENQGQWNKIEIVLDGNDLSVYVNGRWANKVDPIEEIGGRIYCETHPGLELRNMKITMLE